MMVIKDQNYFKGKKMNLFHCIRKDKIGFNTPVDQWMQKQKWEKLASECYENLKKRIPSVFVKEGSLPKDAIDRWKIIQLSKWMDIFLKG